MKRRTLLTKLTQLTGLTQLAKVAQHFGSDELFASGFEDQDSFAVNAFGTKPSVAYFENFESYATGNAISPVGRIRLSNSTSQTISAERAFSGIRSLQNNYSLNDFPKNYLSLSGTRRQFYFCCHLHYSGTLFNSRVWKQGRIGAGEVYNGLPRAGESWTSNSSLPSSFGGEIVNSNGITSWSEHNAAASNSQAAYRLNEWMFYEFEHDSGTLENSDSITRVRVNNTPVLVWQQRPFLTGLSPTLPTWFLTPMNGLDGSPALKVNMDEVYWDESSARVIFTDAEQFNASSIFNVQPILRYSDTELVTRRNTPSFQIGQTVYVHAWSDAGVYQYLGTRVLT